MSLWLVILLVFVSFAAGFIASALLKEKENEQTENTLADIHARLRVERRLLRRNRAIAAAAHANAGTDKATLRHVNK